VGCWINFNYDYRTNIQNIMNKPLITIGITAYRENKYLAKSLNSVKNQTSNDWRAILVLDGGNDKKTFIIFDEFEHENFQKYACDQNLGAYGSRNKAIK
jgi:glycosyltransferase involved in cell wall biosynthesis